MTKVFLDCGTHLGMGFSRLVPIVGIDEDWDVYGFEANPIVFDEYVKNIQSGKCPTLVDKNISLENKAVWINNDGIDFSLRGISQEHYDKLYKDGKDKSNPFYTYKWEPTLANMAAESHGLTEEDIIEMPWDGGSTVSQFKDKINDTPQRDALYKWHEDVKVESIDISQWILDTFSKDDRIVMKMDIEGSEYEVLPKMIEDGSINYVNQLYIEWHDYILPEYKEMTPQLQKSLGEAGVQVGGWY